MKCERCGKRLSRKTARLINGQEICSACLFAPLDALRATQGIEARKGQDRETGLGRNDESPVAESDAPNPSGPTPPIENIP